MLPDLWRMVDRRVRPIHGPIARSAAAKARVRSLGYRASPQVVRWFHSAEAFLEERRTIESARSRWTLELGLFAHIAWELCLDGSLVRREGLEETLQTLRDSFDPWARLLTARWRCTTSTVLNERSANAAHSRMRCRGSLRSSLEAG